MPKIIKKSRSNPKYAKNCTIEDEEQKNTSLNKTQKKIGSMRSTRLRFLETTSFSVHIKTLSSKIVKHQIMPELGPREQSSRSKIIATISPRNQTCLTQTPFSLQRNLSEKNPLSPSSTILKNKQ